MENMDMTEKQQEFNCFSRNLGDFLKERGIKPLNAKPREHSLGMQLSKDDGATWIDYTNIHEILKDHEDLYTAKELQGIHKKVLKYKLLATKEGILFRKRIRKYDVFVKDKELEDSLVVWKETGPNKDK